MKMYVGSNYGGPEVDNCSNEASVVNKQKRTRKIYKTQSFEKLTPRI